MNSMVKSKWEMKLDEGSAECKAPLQGQSGDQTLDTLFEKMGLCGRFQVVFTTLAILPYLVSTWGTMFMTFGSYNPGWVCQDGPELRFNNSTTTDKDIFREPQVNISECDSMRVCSNVTVNTLASTIVTEWGLYCEDSWVPPIIVSIQMVGYMLGSIVAGQLGDKYGRKVSVYGGTALICLGSLVGVFSISWKMYAVIRLFIGLGCGCIMGSYFVYISEFLTAKWRAFLGIFPFWSIGLLTFGLCAMWLKDWRHVHLATSVVSFVAFLPVCWLPESLRILTVNGDLQRGHRVVEKIARMNKKPVPEAAIMTVVSQAEKENIKSRSTHTYWDLFDRSVRKCTIVIGINWFTIMLGYYMVGFGLGALSGDFFVNLLLYSVIPVPAKMISAVIVTKVGRKPALILPMFLSCVCSFSVVGIQFLAPVEHKSTPTIVMAFGANMMLGAARGVINIYNGELFPTPIRNLAFGFSNGLGHFAAVIAPNLISKGQLPLYGSFLLLASIVLICLCGLVTLPETIKRPLQDNMQGTTKSKKRDQHGAPVD